MDTTLRRTLMLLLAAGATTTSLAQGPRRGTGGERRGSGGPRPHELGASPLDLGAAGIAWYPKLEDGLAEAERSNRPILFMAAASQCGGVPGVF